MSYGELHGHRRSEVIHEKSAPEPPSASKSKSSVSKEISEEFTPRQRRRRTTQMERGGVEGRRTQGVTGDWEETGLLSLQIEGLRDKVCGEDYEGLCICAEKVQVGQHIKTLPCGHVFHSQCIIRVLFLSTRCPLDDSEVFSTSHISPKAP